MKLNEARTKSQEYEDKIADLTSELNKSHVEQKRLQEVSVLAKYVKIRINKLRFYFFFTEYSETSRRRCCKRQYSKKRNRY